MKVAGALERWVGLPYAPLGRGPDAYDCWGLVAAVYAAAGCQLPDPMLQGAEAADQLLAARAALDWRMVAESRAAHGFGPPLRHHAQPALLDVVLFSVPAGGGARDPHVGLIASEDGRGVLQALGPSSDIAAARGACERTSEVVELARDPWARWLVAIYRPPEGQEARLA